tara:strand:- start:4201 stop:5010 length:810 start_codon:yes stop_codon:yes gene_type:complete
MKSGKINIQDKTAVICSMENNMLHKLKYIPSKINSMDVTEIGSTLVVDSNLPSDTFNTAFGGLINNQVTLDVMQYYKNNKQPMAWWIGPSSQVDTTNNHLETAGFIHDEFDVGMVCDITLVENQYKKADNLEIKKCVMAQDFKDFGEVLASIFDPVDEQVKIFYQKISLIPAHKRKGLVLFVGYEDNKPVATSGLFLTDVAGIYDISTKPKMQGKGYGSAMFYTALIEAKNQGFNVGVLQASPDGLNIYKRFGYKEICEFNVWSNQQSL